MCTEASPGNGEKRSISYWLVNNQEEKKRKAKICEVVTELLVWFRQGAADNIHFSGIFRRVGEEDTNINIYIYTQKKKDQL